jgi:phytoene/squalene synthetase
MYEASFAACAATLRRADPDRYFSALFAPAETRPLLFALYALNHELARVAESAREPMLGEIRLQWWREALAEAREMRPRRHDVVEAMATVFSACDLPSELVDRMIDARSFDVSGDQFADYAALEDYLDRTSGTLVRLAARILEGAERFEMTATHAGVAYGLVGIARSVAFHAQRGKSFVPRSQLDEAGTTRENLLLPTSRDALLTVVHAMAARAIERHRGARVRADEQTPFAAFLPAALVPLYAWRTRRPSFDPMRPEVGLHWRLATMLTAAVRGRI